MVAYVHIEYSTCQFSEESKGGGGIHPPPPVLTVPKKHAVLRELYEQGFSIRLLEVHELCVSWYL